MRSSSSVIPGVLLCTALGAAQTVQIANGTIQGGKCASSSSNYFFSIPYAQPPTRDLRLAPPQPHLSPFNGTLDATAEPPSCMQYSSMLGESGSQSEDCLYLNIWAPSSATPESKLPVKVWLYGGSNEAGGIADGTYDGCYATTDSIIVSLNYRVGPLGYLALSNLGLTGNYGTMDQLLGLRWVQENIGAFGGDASKVLLFGQSAGATDTYTIATLAEAPKLIRAAAMESGGGRDAPTQQKVQTWHQRFLDALNCTTADISCVRAASTEAIKAANDAMPSDPAPGASTPFTHGVGETWGPVVDGSLVPVTPSTVGAQVPSIFGFNAAEGTLFVLGTYGASALLGGLNQSIYDEFLAYNFGPLASVVNATYSVDLFNGSYYKAMSEIIGEVSYKCSAHRGLKSAQNVGIPVWSYEFAHQPSCAWYSQIPASVLDYVSATHTAEIPFVFNTTTNMPLPGGDCNFTDAEKSVAEVMSEAWTSMAAAGFPADAMAWPQWSTNSSAGVNIDDAVVVGTVDYTTCAFWDAIYEQSLSITQCS